MSCIKQIRELINGTPNWTSYGGLPSTCIRPGVNFKIPSLSPPNDIVMLASTTLALACGDERYLRNARWCLRQEERTELLHKMDTGVGEGDGTLSKADFKAFCKNPEMKIWVLNVLPSSAHGLACRKLMDRAFDHFDTDKNGVLDMREFNNFMDFLGQLRLRYLQQIAFVAFRAYWGRGQPALEYGHGINTQCHVRQLVDSLQEEMKVEEKNNPKLKNEFEIGILVKDWKGWFHDLVYYSANLHPLHGIWACCANNRLDRSDRLMMEVAVLAYCFWLSMERLRMKRDDTIPPILVSDRYFRWACVTIPSMILYFMLYFLFTTPKCGTVDESSAKLKVINRARRVSQGGDMIGNFLVFALISTAVYRTFDYGPSTQDGLDNVWATIYARGLAYCTAWASYVGVYFNPFIAWGTVAPLGKWENGEFVCTKPSYFGMLGDLLGLGQWTMERRKVRLTTLVLPEVEVDLTESIKATMTGESITKSNPGAVTELPAAEAEFIEGALDALDALPKPETAGKPEAASDVKDPEFLQSV